MSELISAGVSLMIMGMGTVFVFLTVLVFGTTLMSQIIMRLPASLEPEPVRSGGSRANNEDLAEVAAVAAAVSLVHKR